MGSTAGGSMGHAMTNMSSLAACSVTDSKPMQFPLAQRRKRRVLFTQAQVSFLFSMEQENVFENPLWSENLDRICVNWTSLNRSKLPFDHFAQLKFKVDKFNWNFFCLKKWRSVCTRIRHANWWRIWPLLVYIVWHGRVVFIEHIVRPVAAAVPSSTMLIKSEIISLRYEPPRPAEAIEALTDWQAEWWTNYQIDFGPEAHQPGCDDARRWSRKSLLFAKHLQFWLIFD